MLKKDEKTTTCFQSHSFTVPRSIHSVGNFMSLPSRCMDKDHKDTVLPVMRREGSIHLVEWYSHNNTDELQVHCGSTEMKEARSQRLPIVWFYLRHSGKGGTLENRPMILRNGGESLWCGTVLHPSCGDMTLCTYPNPTNCIQQRVTFTKHCISQQVGWGDPK